MLRAIFILIAIISVGISQPAPFESRITNEQIQGIADTDEIIDIDPSLIYQNIDPVELNLSSQSKDKSIYIYEPFNLNLTAKTDKVLDFDMNLTMRSNNITWLNPKPLWSKKSAGVYETTIWLLASSSQSSIESLTLTLNRNGMFFQNKTIKPDLPLIKSIELKENFANFVGEDLKIEMIKSSKFNEYSNLTTIELISKNGNLTLFNIPGEFQKQGFDSLKGDFKNQNGIYFIISDNNITDINFSYYNPIYNIFNDINLTINVQDSDLSTQVPLNPKEGEFKLYKDLSIYFAIIIFLVIFIWKKSYYSLVIAIAFIAYSLYDNKPFSDAKLKTDTKVRILPTSNSTIFAITTKEQDVKIITKKDNYTKVILQNQTIGWVENENIK
ncbi:MULTISPECIES: hypothetical protein [Campylobacter]|uniref:SH3 domain-containing protein n=1 Tax=Campylobacter vicugnae TaxID=1660076 RepID=A0ABZ2EA11_9BACT|nr:MULTISPECIES: hypothetical protein [unclassified Campylobacter]ARR03984.1 putative membrane protein [Campylobacter sp. RM12175]MCR8689959.1 hypothetical protein [Campylobacter sp. RM9264]MCR8700443.1 hypothetical protein [Campylobacter sp. RM12176]